MKTGMKIFLFILGGMIVLCLAGSLLFAPAMKYISQRFAYSIGLESAKAEELASEMVKYEVPGDFQEPYGFRMGDYSLITYLGEDGQSHIYFMQVPQDSAISKEEMLDQAQKMSGGTIGTEFKNAKTLDAVILDQSVTVWLLEGINSANQPYRQAMTIFDGRNGTLMVVFERPAASWDEGELLDFLASIH